MSQKVVEVKLTVSEGMDILVFCLDEENLHGYTVNLNSANSQNELKTVFSKLLQLLFEDEISLELTVADDYTRGLYKDVCKEYIDDLNRELLQVKEIINREIS